MANVLGCSNASKTLIDYNGIQFDSKLAAQWAVFLETCGFQWKYKPKTFTLKDGSSFTPDFAIFRVSKLKMGRHWQGVHWLVVDENPSEETLKKVDSFYQGRTKEDEGWQQTQWVMPYHNTIIVGSIPEGKDLKHLVKNHLSHPHEKDKFSFKYIHPSISKEKLDLPLLLGINKKRCLSLVSDLESLNGFESDLTYLGYQTAISMTF